MNKMLLAGAGLMFGMAAAGAVILGQNYVEAQNQRLGGDYPARPMGNSLVIYIDPLTKCEYIRPTGSNTALTPRISSDGVRQAGCGAPRQQSLAEFERR